MWGKNGDFKNFTLFEQIEATENERNRSSLRQFVKKWQSLEVFEESQFFPHSYTLEYGLIRAWPKQIYGREVF